MEQADANPGADGAPANPFDILNQVGCAYERIQAAMRIISEGMHEPFDQGWNLTKGQAKHFYDLWLLLEMVRNEIDHTDAKFHAAESILFQRKIPAQFDREARQ